VLEHVLQDGISGRDAALSNRGARDMVEARDCCCLQPLPHRTAEERGASVTVTGHL